MSAPDFIARLGSDSCPWCLEDADVWNIEFIVVSVVNLTGSVDPAPSLHLPLVTWTLSFFFKASGIIFLFSLPFGSKIQCDIFNKVECGDYLVMVHWELPPSLSLKELSQITQCSTVVWKVC
jgi:hypothetical protein